MKRIATAIVVLAALLAPWGTPARADYHGLCATTAGDQLQLRASGGQLVYNGTVVCDGMTIDLRVVITKDMAAEPLVDENATCVDSCEIAGMLAPEVGSYHLAMTFTVTNETATRTRERTRQEVFLGSGQPLETCPAFSVNYC
jgi:hypothetical protein